MIIRCLLFLVLVVPTFAAPRAVRLKMETLELRNGHKLQDVLIWNYDDVTGKVVVHVGKNISTIPFEFLPDEVAKKVAAQAKAGPVPVRSEKTPPVLKESGTPDTEKENAGDPVK